MRIGFCTLDWSDIRDQNGHPTPGGAGWYRMALPQRYLARNGVEAYIGQQIGQEPSGEIVLKDWDGHLHRDLDIIVLQRWMEASGPPALLRARAFGQIIVSDVDDWMEGLDPSNKAFGDTHPNRRGDPFADKQNINHYRKILAASSAISVSTPYLRDRYAKKLPNMPIEVIRNAIDLERWSVPDIEEEPIVGWVGATMFRSRDLEAVGPYIKTFLSRHPEVGFYHGGVARHWPSAMEAIKLRDLPNPMTYVPMTGIERYPNLFAGMNIGTVPLSDTPFNLAKSCIKGMEYAASGIPFVSSATPEYQWLSKVHNIGLVAWKPKMWLAHLERLLDPDERLRLGTEGRSAVASLDMAERWESWGTWYADLISNRP